MSRVGDHLGMVSLFQCCKRFCGFSDSIRRTCCSEKPPSRSKWAAKFCSTSVGDGLGDLAHITAYDDICGTGGMDHLKYYRSCRRPYTG